MTRHHASGRWRLGLVLSLGAAGFWATLPIALKITLEQIDPYTLTWFRFVVAFVVLGVWLAATGRLRTLVGLTGRHGFLLALATLGLIGNYVFYLLGVHYTSPANAQLLIQLAPLLMAMGGIFVFGERFSPEQWFGLAVLVGGLGLFFFDRLFDQLDQGQTGGSYLLGSGLVVLGAVVWAVYALAQKQLLLRLSSWVILWVVFAVASVALWPLAQPSTLIRLDGLHWALLIYCAFNTLGAYGCFAEALAHWEASRVSVVLAVTPILAILGASTVSAFWPEVLAPERITTLGWIGAGAVVVGSALTSVLGRRKSG